MVLKNNIKYSIFFKKGRERLRDADALFFGSIKYLL
jgi:hypothetical protein